MQDRHTDTSYSRSNSTMYPSSYGRLWHPGHGINFTPARPEEEAHPRVDMLRSLHTTSANSSQSAAAESNESEYILSEDSSESITSGDDDVPFSTAPEFQPESDAASTTLSDGTNDPEARVLTDLKFQIPEDAFLGAQNAPEGSPESFYTYTLYRGPSDEEGEKKVKVHYCKSKHTMERVCQYFLEDKVLGFDLEWYPRATRKSGPRQNVSLIQLANESRIALFHVALFPAQDDLVSPTFIKIMGDPSVAKTGVAIKGDCTRLNTHLGVPTRGIFELSHLHKLVKYSKEGQYDLINKRLVPLAVQVKEHLGLPMFKGQDVRSSDWSRVLKPEQLIYSATDAYAGFQLYHELERKRVSLDPTPPRPHFAELVLPIRLADGAAVAADDIDGAEKKTDGSVFFLTEVEGESIAESIQKAPAVTPKRTQQKDPRVAAAEERMASYKASAGPFRATGPAVRSYFIWRDNEDLDPEAIAKLLREPPLQTMTVVTYILEAIKLQTLPFDKKRLREECLSRLSTDSGRGRYKSLMQEASEPDA
ncbi:Werner syndrome ATP-dependent helicase [Colletotrichum siamense]|nr:Werner syndrome ATP-dependent helicase [Colletotrichum siamense]